MSLTRDTGDEEVEDEESDPEASMNSSTEQNPEELMFKDNARVVVITNGGLRSGTVRWQGHTPLAQGLFVGVELDVACGRHDGEVGGTRYFQTKPNHALLARAINVEILAESVVESNGALLARLQAMPVGADPHFTSTAPANNELQDNDLAVLEAFEDLLQTAYEGDVNSFRYIAAQFLGVKKAQQLVAASDCARLGVVAHQPTAMWKSSLQRALKELDDTQRSHTPEAGAVQTPQTVPEQPNRKKSKGSKKRRSLMRARSALSAADDPTPGSTTPQDTTQDETEVGEVADQEPQVVNRVLVHLLEGEQLSVQHAHKHNWASASARLVYEEGRSVRLTEPVPFSSVNVGSVFPVWNEIKTFEYTGDVKACSLLIDVTDQTDASIGRIFLPLQALSASNPTATVLSSEAGLSGLNQWFHLYDAQLSKRVSGSLHMRVALDSSEVEPSLTQRLQHFKNDFRPRLPVELNVSIFTATWNMGNAPPPANLSRLIPVGPHDLYVIGTQECKYEAREAYASCKEDFKSTLIRHMGRFYTLVAYHDMWEIRTAVFARNRLVPFLSGFTFHSQATGIANVLGNKGAVAVSFHLNHTSLCFVNAHLAAHQGELQKRNTNYRDIIRHTKVGLGCPWTRMLPDIHNQFHHLFFLGDLNYRLDIDEEPRIPTAECFSKIESMIRAGEEGWKALQETDQLIKVMKTGEAFSAYHEGPLLFRPTFKVFPNMRCKYNRHRSPAWCDRILWRSAPDSETHCPLVQKSYRSCDALDTSDHKPVSATFTLGTSLLPGACDPNFPKCDIRITDLVCQGLVDATQRKLDNSKKKNKALGTTFHSLKIGFRAGKHAARSAMKGKNKATHSSDVGDFAAFCEISAPFLSDRLTTEVTNWEKGKTHHAWHETSPAVGVSTNNNPQRLIRSFLWIQVSNLEGELVGQAMQPLSIFAADIEENRTRTRDPRCGKMFHKEFVAELNYAGHVSGGLRGMICLQWDPLVEG